MRKIAAGMILALLLTSFQVATVQPAAAAKDSPSASRIPINLISPAMFKVRLNKLSVRMKGATLTSREKRIRVTLVGWRSTTVRRHGHRYAAKQPIFRSDYLNSRMRPTGRRVWYTATKNGPKHVRANFGNNRSGAARSGRRCGPLMCGGNWNPMEWGWRQINKAVTRYVIKPAMWVVHGCARGVGAALVTAIFNAGALRSFAASGAPAVVGEAAAAAKSPYLVGAAFIAGCAAGIYDRSIK